MVPDTLWVSPARPATSTSGQGDLGGASVMRFAASLAGCIDCIAMQSMLAGNPMCEAGNGALTLLGSQTLPVWEPN